MRSGVEGPEDEARVCWGARNIAPWQETLDALRRRTGQAGDVQTSVDWFLSRTLMWRAVPVVVLLHRAGQVQAAVLLHARRFLGLPTGLLKTGDLVGAGGVIAAAGERRGAVECAAQALFRTRLAHTVVATVQEGDDDAPPAAAVPARLVEGVWHAREIRAQLSLSGGTPGLLARTSRKFRRNFRYYRRRAEQDQGCRFLPQLGAGQSQAAVAALHARAVHPIPAARARLHEEALRRTPGAFAMGLVDGRGEWLSYLAGWREGAVTYLEWQLNRDDRPAASLSTVMRAYFLEHEAARQAQSVVFVGGTTASWAGACRPAVCMDLLATRSGRLGSLLNAAAIRMRPQGQVARLRRQQRGIRPAGGHAG